MQDQHELDIQNYYSSQIALLQDQIDDLTLASTYAVDDLQDGFTTLTDKINDFRDDKNAAFDQQHALVENYFTRALAEEKNLDEVLDAMNVHYI